MAGPKWVGATQSWNNLSILAQRMVIHHPSQPLPGEGTLPHRRTGVIAVAGSDHGSLVHTGHGQWSLTPLPTSTTHVSFQRRCTWMAQDRTGASPKAGWPRWGEEERSRPWHCTVLEKVHLPVPWTTGEPALGKSSVRLISCCTLPSPSGFSIWFLFPAGQSLSPSLLLRFVILPVTFFSATVPEWGGEDSLLVGQWFVLPVDLKTF
jgi:hypothetical protein